MRRRSQQPDAAAASAAKRKLPSRLDPAFLDLLDQIAQELAVEYVRLMKAAVRKEQGCEVGDDEVTR